MTAVPNIRCDGEDPGGGMCFSEDVPPGGVRTFTESRQLLQRRHGWHRTKDGRDLCPDCWAQGQR